MPMIEIPSRPGISLADLLDHVHGRFKWSIMELWAVGRSATSDVVAIEEQAARSPVGLTLSERELREIAREFHQLIDGVIVGFRGRPPKRSDSDLRDSAEVVIEAIDSTLWRVYAVDAATITALRWTYSDAREVEPQPSIPPVHES